MGFSHFPILCITSDILWATTETINYFFLPHDHSQLLSLHCLLPHFQELFFPYNYALAGIICGEFLDITKSQGSLIHSHQLAFTHFIVNWKNEIL
jgi:hypothetical protein